MPMSFQLSGLDHEPFAELFDLTDAELASCDMIRRVADVSFGFPCRVSLEDAAVGDQLLLLPFVHQPVASPYRASGPIFVRRGATRARLPNGLVPPCVTQRLISLRAYDHGHLMIDADVVDGSAVAEKLRAMFCAEAVAYIHLHNARQGCFSCTALRA